MFSRSLPCLRSNRPSPVVRAAPLYLGYLMLWWERSERFPQDRGVSHQP